MSLATRRRLKKYADPTLGSDKFSTIKYGNGGRVNTINVDGSEGYIGADVPTNYNTYNADGSEAYIPDRSGYTARLNNARNMPLGPSLADMNLQVPAATVKGSITRPNLTKGMPPQSSMLSKEGTGAGTKFDATVQQMLLCLMHLT